MTRPGADPAELVELAARLAALAAALGEDQVDPAALKGVAGRAVAQSAHEEFCRVWRPGARAAHGDLTAMARAVEDAALLHREDEATSGHAGHAPVDGGILRGQGSERSRPR